MQQITKTFLLVFVCFFLSVLSADPIIKRGLEYH